MLTEWTIAHARKESPRILLRRLHNVSQLVPEACENHDLIIDEFEKIERDLENRATEHEIPELWDQVFDLFRAIPRKPWVLKAELYIAEGYDGPDP
ncbi:MAG: hypothetical protein JWL88_653 [Parcubacteria group bacterium]|nr:hypothetical protein [Parcubacteria group bacterium]